MENCKFKVGDNVMLAYISDCNKYNNKVGTLTWLHNYKYYPNGDINEFCIKQQGIITYDDAYEMPISDINRKGSGLVSSLELVQ